MGLEFADVSFVEAVGGGLQARPGEAAGDGPLARKGLEGTRSVSNGPKPRKARFLSSAILRSKIALDKNAPKFGD
jgi:hypothetical protein